MRTECKTHRSYSCKGELQIVSPKYVNSVQELKSQKSRR